MNKNEVQSIPSRFLAISPLDGRYSEIGEALSLYFSEYGLVKNRVWVEVNWLIFMIENLKGSRILEDFSKKKIQDIRSIYDSFSEEAFIRVKEIEGVTNHDVKAVEIYVAEELRVLGMDELVSYVHIGCTSEDITNCAYANIIKKFFEDIWIPEASKLISVLEDFSMRYADISMLAHTHGQPATPTTVGKEFAVFVYRLRKSLENVNSIRQMAKFNGATGNYAAISVAFPKENWPEVNRKFVEEILGLTFNPVTTQIESHDYMCHLFDAVRHFNNVLHGFDVDMWMYISMEYFNQKVVKNEVGSSTMPHKVNPIKFENSEANCEISNGLLITLSNELASSRMQRDLTDSSSQRNIGIAFGYSLQAIRQTINGMKRVQVNIKKITEALESNWEVLAEPIQTMLRKYGIPDAYDKLKELTRGKKISREDIQEFIKSLDVLSDEDRENLLQLTPGDYIGYACQIAEEVTNNK